MLIRDLQTTLKKRYLNAAKGEQVLSLYLFGIEFADQLSGVALYDLCEAAGLSRSYGTELAKARKLAPYVSLK